MSIDIDNFADEGRACRGPLNKIGFDITLVISVVTSKSGERAARKKNMIAHLQDGEKGKFERPRGGQADDGSKAQHLLAIKLFKRSSTPTWP